MTDFLLRTAATNRRYHNERKTTANSGEQLAICWSFVCRLSAACPLAICRESADRFAGELFFSFSKQWMDTILVGKP